MGELLLQGLNLTIVGMGMTFAAIGVLVAGMYGLTTFLADEDASEAPTVSDIPASVAAPDDQAGLQIDVGRQRAAAAAVAVALAQAEDAYRARRPGQAMSGDAWTAHVRATQLARRDYYTSLRARR